MKWIIFAFGQRWRSPRSVHPDFTLWTSANSALCIHVVFFFFGLLYWLSFTTGSWY